ncbi:MAG: peptide deformylase [Parcubacteria group bacterium 21-54-25]|nr:MAG: peptide deformylase [Parcubacteria group bacterium 21-54-25]HQU07658.1 peptide deformylase [Candidatus Paceibacterota bacterium]
MTSSIVQADTAPILRQKATAVPETLFGTPELARIIAAMTSALDAELDGVALAAPQVGLPHRLFVVRYDRILPREEGAPVPAANIGVYINPEIIKTARRTEVVDEGCLSVRGIYGKTTRHSRATVRARDAAGRMFVRGAGGLLAQVFQHEIDHLEGILFIDHAIDLYTLRDKTADNHDSESPS